MWFWVGPVGAGARATMALSSNRKTMDADREFEQLRLKLLAEPSHETSHEGASRP